jgi:hypothetical protein
MDKMLECEIDIDWNEWDEAVKLMPAATFFDGSCWLKRFGYKVQKVETIAYREGNRIVGLLAYGLTGTDDALHVKVPFSASHGGILYKEDMAMLSMIDMFALFVDRVKQLAGRRELVISYTQRPKYLSFHPQYELEEFAILKNGFYVDNIYVDYFVDLNNLRYSRSLREKINRNDRGDYLFGRSDIEEFIDFRSDIMKQQGKEKTMPDDELRIFEVDFDQYIKIYKVTYDSNITSMILSYNLNDNVIYGINWFQDSRYKTCDTTAYLLYRWLQKGIEEKKQIASLGTTGNLNKPLRPGLLFFKERFKPSASLRKTYILRAT